MESAKNVKYMEQRIRRLFTTSHSTRHAARAFLETNWNNPIMAHIFLLLRSGGTDAGAIGYLMLIGSTEQFRLLSASTCRDGKKGRGINTIGFLQAETPMYIRRKRSASRVDLLCNIPHVYHRAALQTYDFVTACLLRWSCWLAVPPRVMRRLVHERARSRCSSP